MASNKNLVAGPGRRYRLDHMTERRAKIVRKTSETSIRVELNLDGKGKAQVKTGVGFLDHMLCAFAKHSVCDLKLRCSGDLHIDAHHTAEDSGIALGQAVARALGDRGACAASGAHRRGRDAARDRRRRVADRPPARA